MTEISLLYLVATFIVESSNQSTNTIKACGFKNKSTEFIFPINNEIQSSINF
jgi:hypothetical protein